VFVGNFGFLARMDVTKQEDMSAFYRNMLDQTTDVVVKTEPAQNENTASPDEGYSICSSYVKSLIMTALHSRCGHYIFALWFLLFFPRLISAVADWMSAILPHMVWP